MAGSEDGLAIWVSGGVGEGEYDICSRFADIEGEGEGGSGIDAGRTVVTSDSLDVSASSRLLPGLGAGGTDACGARPLIARSLRSVDVFVAMAFIRAIWERVGCVIPPVRLVP